MNSPDLVLYLLRHGQTEGKIKIYKGLLDVPLSKEGESQAKKVSKFLLPYMKRYDLKPEVIYSSPLKRALSTAEIIGKELSLKIKKADELKERSFGKWEGLSINEIISIYPEEFEKWRSNPLRFSPPDGESTLQLRRRAKKIIKQIINNHRGSQIFVVGHGSINRVILCDLLGLPLKNIFRIEQDFACINIVEFYNSSAVIKLINGIFWR